MRWSLVAVLLAATLSGCFGANEENPAAPLGSEDDGTDNPDVNGTDDNETSPPPQNGTPIRELSANITANITNGSSPLNVTFYLNFTDGDMDDLDWTLDFGDGNMTNGTLAAGDPPQTIDGVNATGNGTGNETDGNATGNQTGGGPDGNGTDPNGNQTGNGTTGSGSNATGDSFSYGTITITYSYNLSGPYNVTLSVSDDNSTAEANLTVEVAPAAIVFEGEVTTKCGTSPGTVGTCGLTAGLGSDGAPVNAGLGCQGMRSDTQGSGCIWFDILPEHIGLDFTADSTGGDVDLAFTTSCNENSGRTLAYHAEDGPEAGTVPADAVCVILWEFGTVPSTITYTMPL